MKRHLQKKDPKPALGVVLVVAASALVGVWQARVPIQRSSASVAKDVAETDLPTTRQLQADRVEQALAQAGCPGWMVLASEGPQALGPEVVAPEVRQTSTRIPRIKYPNPVRVASRPTRASSRRQASESTSATSDSDDLLDGLPDLLWDTEPPTTSENIESEVEDATSASGETSDSAGNQQAPSQDQPASDETPETTEEPSTGEPATTDAAAPHESDASETPVAAPAETTAEETPAEPPLRAPATGKQVEATSPEPQTPITPTPRMEPPATPAPGAAPVESLPIDEEPAAEPDRLIFPPPPGIVPGPAPPQRPQQEPVPPPALPAPQSTPGAVAEPAEPVETSPAAVPDRGLFSPPAAPHSVRPPTTSPSEQRKERCEFVADSLYPSAFACAKCHEKIFEEWSVSSHAYAAVSPMFQKFEQKINDLSQGTVGYFCYRCHTPAGVSMGISRAAPLWDLPQVAREGVTCVACHRVNQRYGKVNGERRIETGDIFAPVYGSIGGSGVAEAIARKGELKVKVSPHEQGPGQDMHVAGFCFDQLSKADFCVSCHQVAVHPGIKLEVVWEQYRASPACKKGISCQDCHMGRIPGVPSGYEVGSAALVNNKSVNTRRKHSNHLFYGPGYSIAHPGVFPHNKDALRWSMRDWLLFDYRAGWGTEAFEELVESGQVCVQFPPAWAEVDDRYDARDIIDDNLKKLQVKSISRQQVMENGSHVDGPFFNTQLERGQDLRFHYIVTNTNEGHNMPSGSLGAQPQLWANVVLIGPRGQRLWESGYTDRWGDVADIHSVEVRNKTLPYDWQLFNLQSMFLITGVKGTDREFFLPVNVDIDQLPFLRPGAQPISVINHPPFIRMEGRSLAPLGSRRAPYRIPGELLREPGCYRLSFRLRMRPQPIYFMRFCGATVEMQRNMNDQMTDFHQNSYQFMIR